MNNKISALLFISCYLLVTSAKAQSTNEAIEPQVKGADVIQLTKAKTLDAWKIPSANWAIKDGVIIGQTGDKILTTPEWLYTKQRFSDFEFTCELKLSGDGRRNTGIYYRVNTFTFKNAKGNKSYNAPSGYEFDASFTRQGRRNFNGALADWYSRPSLRIFPEPNIINQAHRTDGWNRMTIRARSNRLEYWINGIKVMDYLDHDPNGSNEGVIGFQMHDGSNMQVEYKNVRVRPLKL